MGVGAHPHSEIATNNYDSKIVVNCFEAISDCSETKSKLYKLINLFDLANVKGALFNVRKEDALTKLKILLLHQLNIDW